MLDQKYDSVDGGPAPMLQRLQQQLVQVECRTDRARLSLITQPKDTAAIILGDSTNGVSTSIKVGVGDMSFFQRHKTL